MNEEIMVKHLSGSHAYGMSTPTSDVDYRGIFMCEKKFILTPFFTMNEITDTSEEDTKFYELNNYMKLYTNGNPNILESLWVDESDIILKTDCYDVLRSYRSDLLSKKVAFTYTGYAHNQFTRMDNHHSWIDKEREAITKLQQTIDTIKSKQVAIFVEKYFPDYIKNLLDLSDCNDLIRCPVEWVLLPLLKDHRIQMISSEHISQSYFVKLVHNYKEQKILDNMFDIMNYNEDHEMIPYGSDIYAVVKKAGSVCFNEDGSIHKVDTSNRTPEELKIKPEFIVKFNKDEYLRSNDNRKNYHHWKKNRNESRAALEKQFGYDGKAAAHTVRLLRTAEELLSTGECNVKRPDATELLEIRNGKWTYQELTDYYKEKDTYIREVLYNQSALPKKPDIKLATKVLIDLREAHWYGK